MKPKARRALIVEIKELAARQGYMTVEQIDGRRPAGRARGKPVQTLLDGEQVPNRIPARERHGCDRTPGIRIQESGISRATI